MKTNETNTPELLAAIIAEMRGNEFDDPHLDADGIIGARRLARDWADRIEAAAEREREELCRQLRNEIQINDALATVRPGLHSVGDVMAEAAKERAHEIELAKLRAPGNAAALREALVEILDRTNKEKARDPHAAIAGGILEIHDIANTALAEFDRTLKGSSGDADRFATAEATMPSPTPTPPGTPTQVYVRFIGERPEGIECQIGCDGEENAPPNTRKTMALVAHSIAAAFLVAGDAGAADRAEQLAEYIAEGGDYA